MPRADPVPRTGQPALRRRPDRRRARLRRPGRAVLLVRRAEPGDLRRRARRRRLGGLRAAYRRSGRVDRPFGAGWLCCSAASRSSTSSGTTTATRSLRVLWAKEARDPEHDYERWNAFSRLTVDGNPSDVSAAVVGAGHRQHRGHDPGQVVRATRARRDYLRGQVQNMAHFIRRDGDVFVIGVGGGRDVLSALEFEQRSVTGGRDQRRHPRHHERHLRRLHGPARPRTQRVNIVNDEARSYLARTDRKFDIIQISLIDTWAATSAGAFALTENSLYTTQAWDLFFDRLDPGGVLSVTRFYQTANPAGEAVDPIETYRTVALAAQVLTDRGVEDPRSPHPDLRPAHPLRRRPGQRAGQRRALLVGGHRHHRARKRPPAGSHPVLTPDTAADPMLERLTAPGGPGPAVDDVAADISPPTDNRPFFFQMANVRTFFDSRHPPRRPHHPPGAGPRRCWPSSCWRWPRPASPSRCSWAASPASAARTVARSCPSSATSPGSASGSC